MQLSIFLIFTFIFFNENALGKEMPEKIQKSKEKFIKINLDQTEAEQAQNLEIKLDNGKLTEKLVGKDGKVGEFKKDLNGDDQQEKKPNETEKRKEKPKKSQTSSHSCIFDDGIILEAGHARNATKRELAQMKAYLAKVRNYQANIGLQNAKVMQNMQNLMMAPMEQQIMAAPKFAEISMAQNVPVMHPPKPPCFCRKDCENVVILNVGKL